jgi:hypothetical protein
MNLLRWTIVGLLVITAILFFVIRTGRSRSSGPVLEYDTLVDLGEQEYGQIARGYVNFTNRGQAIIVIDQIRSNCSCSGLERLEEGQWVKCDQIDIPPGGSEQLSVRVSVRGQTGGPVQNTITFRTNDTAKPDGEVEVRISKVMGLSASPTSVVIGDLRPGSKRTQIVEVRELGATSTTTIERVSSTIPDVMARVLPDSTGLRSSTDMGPRGKLIGRVEIVAIGKDEKDVAGSIQIDVKRGNVPTRISVAVSLSVVKQYSAHPSVISLPRWSEQGAEYSATCLFRSHNREPVELVVASTPPGLSVNIDNRSKNAATRLISIRLDPASINSKVDAESRIIKLKAIDSVGEFPLEIRVECSTRR